MAGQRYFIDIDGVICTNTDGQYAKARPNLAAICKVNRLYAAGHTVVFWTARGSQTGKDWTTLTREQLDRWGVNYHELRMHKPHYDCFVDDKACSSMQDVII